MARITFTDKVENGGTTADGKLSAANANEIKNSANGAYDAVDAEITARTTAVSASLTSANGYTDSKVEGLQYKNPVDAASVGNVVLSGIQTIDGVATPASVLLPAQTDPKENGIYVPAAGAWSRRSDMNSSAEFPLARVEVKAGTVNGGKTFKCTNNAVTLGTTNIVFVESTVSGLQATSEKGAANGYGSLNGSGKQPMSEAAVLAALTPVNTPVFVGMTPQQTAEALQGQYNSANVNLQVLNANTAKRAGRFSNKSSVVINARAAHTAQLSDGIVITATSRFAYKLVGLVSQMTVYFANFEPIVSNNTLLASDDITIEASIEYPAGTFNRLTFNGGQTSVFLKKGFGIETDVVKFYIPTNTGFWVRTNVLVTSGQKWIIGSVPNSGASPLGGEGFVTGVNSVMSGTIGNTSGYCYGPTAILGVSSTNNASIICFGDSRTAGLGDAGSGQPVYMWNHDGGIYGRAFTDKYPRMVLNEGGQKAIYWDKSASLVANFYDDLLSCCQFGIENLGINDIGSASQAVVQAYKLSLWYYARSRGVKMVCLTIEPRTSSTDGWTTLANQTISIPSDDTKRKNINIWLRDGAPIDYVTQIVAATGTAGSTIIRVGDYRHPVIAVVDTAITVEDMPTGKWIVSGGAAVTYDGLHCNPLGYSICSAPLIAALPIFKV